MGEGDTTAERLVHATALFATRPFSTGGPFRNCAGLRTHARTRGNDLHAITPITITVIHCARNDHGNSLRPSCTGAVQGPENGDAERRTVNSLYSFAGEQMQLQGARDG